MGLENISVRELVERAAAGRLDIPEFQRGFVWRPDQVRSLVDSLFRDYPIGLILGWDSPTYYSPRTAQDGPATKQWLVDGQQRTTAACLMMGRQPSWWADPTEWNRQLTACNVLANIASETPRLEFGLANPVRNADPRWVSVREILSKEPPKGPAPPEDFLGNEATVLAGKLPSTVAKKLPVAEIRSRLRALWEIRNRNVSMTTVQHDLEDVTEIFTRLNQQGTAVLEADVSLAAASALHPGWVRDEFLPFAKNLGDSGFDLDPGVIIRILTGLGVGRSRLDEVPREFWSSKEFDATWQKTRESISAAIGWLMGSGILSSTLVPSRNSLVPLAVLGSKYSPKEYPFPRALHWFLLANRDGRYSGASTTALAQDIRIIQESNSFAEALEALRGTLTVDPKIAPEEFLGRYTWNRPLLLIQYLAVLDRKAMDWVTRRPIGQDRPDGGLEVGFVPYWHPFFPPGKSVLKSVQYDYTEEESAALANIVILNQKPTSRSWSNTPPSKYVRESATPEMMLEQQRIPLDRTLWEPDRYRDFLSERSRLLAEGANRFLASLLSSSR